MLVTAEAPGNVAMRKESPDVIDGACTADVLLDGDVQANTA